MKTFNFLSGNLFIIDDEYGYLLFKGVSGIVDGLVAVILLETNIHGYNEFVGEYMSIGIDDIELIISEKQLYI